MWPSLELLVQFLLSKTCNFPLYKNLIYLCKILCFNTSIKNPNQNQDKLWWLVWTIVKIVYNFITAETWNILHTGQNKHQAILIHFRQWSNILAARSQWWWGGNSYDMMTDYKGCNFNQQDIEKHVPWYDKYNCDEDYVEE
jgi:hypothetical protein